VRFHVEKQCSETVNDYLKAVAAGDAEKAASSVIPRTAGWSRRFWVDCRYVQFHPEGCAVTKGNQANRADAYW